MNEEQKPHAIPAAHGQTDPPLKTVHFRELADGATEVLVEHEGQTYRLRLTRNGKLILNK